MKYPPGFHCPFVSSMNVTVSTADFLLANDVLNRITTYWPSGTPINRVAYCANSKLRDSRLPRGFRTVVSSDSHFCCETAPWNNVDASCQLWAYWPLSISV